jgi:hypothetical protein
MLCHHINTTLNSSVGTEYFFVFTQLNFAIMQLSLVSFVVKVIFHMALISWLCIKGQDSQSLCQM